MSELGYTVGLTAKEQAHLTRTGQVTAVELLDAHLVQVGRFNGELNAVVAMDEERAYEHAKRVDAIPPAERGPLHGLPTAVKDCANAAGFVTTFGHRRFIGNVAAQDDPHISRMRRAGCVFYGKTNIPELAAGSHTVNRVYGATRNPHDTTRSAGGSSGGAAAALAAGFAAVADGSDMGGSLRNPASLCGVVGLRPTPGAVPSTDRLHVFDPLETNGPMARTVADVALLLSVMSDGIADGVSAPRLDHPALRDLQERDIVGLRVAYAPDLGGRVPVDPAVRAVLDDVAATLETAGAIVVEECPDLDGADQAFRMVRAASFQASWGAMLAEDPTGFNDFVSDNIRDGERVTGADLIRAQEEITRLMRAADRFLREFHLVLAPAAQVPAFPIEQDWPRTVAGQPMSDYLDWMRAAWLFSPLGVPAISIPAGYTGRLPVGAQLLAGPGQDVALLEYAQAIESALAVSARAEGIHDLEVSV